MTISGVLQIDLPFNGGVVGIVDGSEHLLAVDESVNLGSFVQTARQIHLGSTILYGQQGLSPDTR